MTDSAPTIAVERSEGVGRILLNRPEASNSVDLATARALGAAIDDLGGDDDVRAVLLLGAGRRFCAGGDVASMAAAPDQAAYLHELADTLDAALQRLSALAKPVVAGVHGAVAGAGLALMLSADLIVAGAGTRFVTAYAGVGLTPDCGLSWLLPRAVGQQRAAELLLTGRTLSADEACSWGMVTRVVDDGAVATDAAALAADLAAGPAHALGQARLLLQHGWHAGRAETGAKESRTIAEAVTHPDAQARIAGFLGRA